MIRKVFLLLRRQTLWRRNFVGQEVDFRFVGLFRPLDEQVARQEVDECFSNPWSHLRIKEKYFFINIFFVSHFNEQINILFLFSMPTANLNFRTFFMKLLATCDVMFIKIKLFSFVCLSLCFNYERSLYIFRRNI